MRFSVTLLFSFAVIFSLAFAGYLLSERQRVNAQSLNFRAERGSIEALAEEGKDIGEKINNAYKALPRGGTIHIPPPAEGECWQFSTPILLATPAKLARLQGDSTGTCLRYTGSGAAITVDWGSQHLPGTVLKDIKLIGPGARGSTVGVALGSNLTDQTSISGVYISNFGIGIESRKAFNWSVESSMIISNGIGILIPRDAGGEQIRINNSNIAQNVVGLSLQSEAVDLSAWADSFDDNTQTSFTAESQEGGSSAEFYSCHWENSGGGTAEYIASTGHGNFRLAVFGGTMMDDATSGARPQFISSTFSNVTIDGLAVLTFGGKVQQVVNQKSSFAKLYLRILDISGHSFISSDYNPDFAGQVVDLPSDYSAATDTWSLHNISLAFHGKKTLLGFDKDGFPTMPALSNCMALATTRAGRLRCGFAKETFNIAAAISDGTTAHAGWNIPLSSGPRVLVRSGTFTSGAVLQFLRGDNAYIHFHLPDEWDSSTGIALSIDLTQGANSAAGKAIQMRAGIACGHTDDAPYDILAVFPTITTTDTPNSEFNSSVQITSRSLDVCGHGGWMNLRISRDANDTAGSGVNVYDAAITLSRTVNND
jgi:hypothetical protein